MPNKLFSKISNRPEDPYIRPNLERSDSIDSDALDPNNPGPGRNVGRLYDALGSKFERFLSNTARLRRKTEQPNTQLGVQLYRAYSSDSVASDATGPNNPGPGRNLGRLYDAVGGRIEDVLNRRAGKLKLGPEAVAEEIRILRQHIELPSGRKTVGFPREATTEEYDCVKKHCRRLLKYCRSQALSTQVKALHEVTELATEDPYIRQALAHVLRNSYLSPKYKEKELFSLSSKAVVSIKDNEVHEFWMDFNENYVNSGRYYKSNSGEDLISFQHRLASYLRCVY
ncbi:hypothetical protein SCHPADRAFT_562249 [Schizopora paradoxa]|uniref:Uncharacterized protein n=1 Tax=Schizopora paradoxa TaxID=27342 RepID=A0A0H2RCI1_9AGAM|nr:hypothetical protein SCHPADRAFT_562249 [Schizopora paradoxa]